MKSEEKKEVKQAPAPNREQIQQSKQSSGDKSFDEAIDRLLKKPAYILPVK